MKPTFLALTSLFLTHLSAQGPLLVDEDFTYPPIKHRELKGESGKWRTDKRAFLTSDAFTDSKATLNKSEGLSLLLYTGLDAHLPIFMKMDQVYYFSYVGRMEDYRPQEENPRLNGIFFKVNDLNQANAPAAGFVKGEFGVSPSSNSGSAFQFVAAPNVNVDETKDYVVVGVLRSRFEGDSKIRYDIAASVFQRASDVPAKMPEWQITSFMTLPRLTREAPTAVYFNSSTGGATNFFDQIRIGRTYESVTSNTEGVGR